MNAVGKLGGYLSRGVVTVSAPFSGAVDIVVVQQQDGSYKSSPWYIQFGKYQGALQASDKVVNINVNGVDADFLMYLNGKGGAFFLREVDGDDGMSESVSSSGDGTDGSSTIRPQKIMSLKLDSESEAKNKKIMTRSSSTGPRVLGFVFGRRSWKENGLQHRENIVDKDIEASLEHAEMTADLLEVRWSTSLVTRKHKKNIALGISDRRSSKRPHDKGEAEIPLSSSSANYMESFTLKETYFDANVLESSVGSDGGDTETNSNSGKSDSGVMLGGDEHSNTSQAVRTGDERRMDRVESSLYCDTSENFMDELDGSSGESSEDLCLSSPVSGKMDIPTGPYGHEKLVFKMNSESPSSILACELFINTEDKDPCRSIDGSSSDSGIGSDVETVLETKVEVVLEHKTNEGPVKYVEEMVVDRFPSSQEPSLPNSFIIEEVTSSIVESLENLRSQKTSGPTSTHLYKLVSCENNENPVGNTKTSNRDAFKALTTNASDHDSYELQKIESVAYMSADSDTEESNSLDFSESSEYKAGLLTGKRNETQFCVSDLDESELTKTYDTQAAALNSLETENDSQYKPKNKEKLGESTGMLNESHSFPVHTIGIDHDQVDQTAQRVKSLPNIWSHEAGMNAEGINHPISCSLDSSFDNMRLAQGVPTTSETGEQKRYSIARPSSMDHTLITEALKKVLLDPAIEVSLCRHLLYEGIGQEAEAQAFEAEKLDLEKLVSLGSDIIRNDRVVVRIGGHYFPWDAALPIISAIGSSTDGQILEPKGMITVDQFENDSEPSIATISTASPRETTGIIDSPKSEGIKKRMVWSKTPTSEQLASLNLKEGRNDVTFTFSTPTIGEQKVDARIYLWKWNANIVISDVDGTITKSDVLGQFMPLVGVDWSQTGVAHLFSAIKENGYELLFLSARAISQASLTRQFLFNLKQDGKALPEGPVVISPDGLLPSLYREVIRRAPHEFKIACLEDIRALFPPDHNPFYAGFGNRDTDELSYIKVGVPKGKVFIINPKGEVAVQRRVDRKTYTSLKTIVHEMFPPPSSHSSSVKEDFNEFHFWRLPLSEIDG